MTEQNTFASWSGVGTMICNNDPVLGGIIDQCIADKTWFVVFNADDLPTIENLESMEAAKAAFLEVMVGR